MAENHQVADASPAEIEALARAILAADAVVLVPFSKPGKVAERRVLTSAEAVQVGRALLDSIQLSTKA